MGFFSVHANVEPGEYGLIVTPLSDVDTIYEDFNLFYEDSIYSKLQAVHNNNVYCLEKGTIERPSVRNIEALLELENIFFTDKK